MKSLIIENQWQPDGDLLDFVKENSELVGEVDIVIDALNKDREEIGAHIAEADQLLLQSTFMYKDQLEELLEGFYHQAFGPRIKRVYCMSLLDKLDRWTKPGKESKNFISNGVPYHPEYDWTATSGFSNHKEFLRQLIDIVETEKLELYDICHEHRVHAIGKPERLMYYDTAIAEGLTREDIDWNDHSSKDVAIRIRYNRELNRFHYEGTEPDPDAYRH